MFTTTAHTTWKACLLRAVGVGAVVAAIGYALPASAETSAQDDCDRMAGSRYDTTRNIAFEPVSEGALANSNVAVIDACRMAFEQTGAPRFAFQLGRAFDGSGDAAQAVKAFTLASDRDYAIAKVHLGMISGRMGDEKTEFNLFKQAAEAGNVLGAYNLGVLYRDGTGTDPDATAAIGWFEHASAKGYGPAAYNLGVIYDEGKIVKEDNTLAIQWYKVGVAQGQVDAMVNLGLMYEGGEGTDRNLVAAAEMYGMAADQGDEFAETKFRAIAAMVASANVDEEHPAIDDAQTRALENQTVEAVGKQPRNI